MGHVCWLIKNLTKGGAERMAVSTVNGLCERGHTVDLVLLNPTNFLLGELSERASVFVLVRTPDRWSQMGRKLANRLRTRKKFHQSAQVSEDFERIAGRRSYHKIPNLTFNLISEHGWSILRIARQLSRKDLRRALRLGYYLEARRPDVVFTNLLAANIAVALASSMFRNCPPVVCVVHNTVIGRYPRLHCPGDWRWLFRKCRHAVMVSEGVKNWFEEAIGISPDRITTIYNPACTSDIARRAAEAPDHPWFFDGGPPILLAAGRFMPQKDFSTLIDAFRRVRAEYSCRLVILGEGPLRQELEGHVRALGLAEYVSLPGWANNPYAFMARSTLFVLSSRHEGFGNVLVEALACGCPAVSTDCPAGPAEILEDRSLLAPVGDPEALADVMLRALASPADKSLLKARAARFSVDRAMDRYEYVMDQISSSGGNGG